VKDLASQVLDVTNAGLVTVSVTKVNYFSIFSKVTEAVKTAVVSCEHSQ
jgi:hypothetical protein